MSLWKRSLQPAFRDLGRPHEKFTITLTRPESGAGAAQSEDFRARLERWLLLHGAGQKGEAKTPETLPAADTGNGRLSIECTERMMALIERQFASDILRVDPPARHVRGAIYPPKVDPWDVSKW
jgi:hypothetical protein